MQNTLITTGVFAAAMALNTGTAFGEDTVNRSRTSSGQEGNQAIVGKLVSLCDYLEKGDKSTTSSSTSNSTSTSSSSRTSSTSASESKQPGSQAGRLGGLGGDRSDSSPESRAQTASQGSTGANQPYTSATSTSRDSSKEQTLVLIAQQGPMQGAQTPSVGLTNPTANQTSSGRFESDQRNLHSASPTAGGGHAYILVFGDDATSQSAFNKAKSLITDGSSNWATSNAETRDRLPVRGEDNASSGARPDGTRAQQTGQNAAGQNAATGRTAQQDSADKWSNSGSQVRVTGALVSRGGIQAIRVSDISLASTSDPASKSTGTLNRDRSNPSGDKKPDYNNKKVE